MTSKRFWDKAFRPSRLNTTRSSGAVAELAQLAGSEVHDLLYISGDVGVGGGIISAGQIMRGAQGSAGEIGHMPLDPARRQCACGRRGCWETMVGLAAFLRLAADESDPVHNPGRPLEDRLRELRRRAEDGDERTLSALATVAEGLGTGVSILVDVLNPGLVVLGGYFAWFEEQLIVPVAEPWSSAGSTPPPRYAAWSAPRSASPPPPAAARTTRSTGSSRTRAWSHLDNHDPDEIIQRPNESKQREVAMSTEHPEPPPGRGRRPARRLGGHGGQAARARRSLAAPRRTAWPSSAAAPRSTWPRPTPRCARRPARGRRTRSRPARPGWTAPMTRSWRSPGPGPPPR